MRFNRKIGAFFLALTMLFAVGCTSDTADDDSKLNIVCTIFPQYDLARSISGNVEGINIKMLLGAGQESHDYDPSSKDIAAVHDCDIFIYVGGESDSWVRDMLESVDTENKTIISLMDTVEPVSKETVEGMETEEHHHDDGVIDHVDYDEHVWTSPVNAGVIADAILDAMCAKMPEEKDSFTANHKILSDELDAVDSSIKELVASVDDPMIVVADRFPLLYFCREYGIRYYAAFSGCAASTEPSSKTVQFLIEKIKSENIPVVFKMDLSRGNVADTVAESTGVEILTFYSCHTVSTEDFDSGVTYTELMERNISALKKALGK